MINKNMSMIKQMQNIYDYDEYVSLCKKNDIEPNDLNRFCMGIGTLMCGRNKYPELDWQEAYIQTFEDMNAQEKKERPAQPMTKKKSSCCGQGEKKSPSMLKKAKNYTKTMAAWVKAGMPRVNMNTYANRLLVCSDCEELIKDAECSKCGCPMKDKAIMDMDNLCELNKW